MATLVLFAGLVLAQATGMTYNQCIANVHVAEAFGTRELLAYFHLLPVAEQQVMLDRAREEMLKDRKRMEGLRSTYEHRVRDGMPDVCGVWR